MGKFSSSIEYGDILANGATEDQLADLSAHGNTPRVQYDVDISPDTGEMASEEFWASSSDRADRIQNVSSAAVFFAELNMHGTRHSISDIKLA